MKKIAITLILAATALLAEGQIDDTLLNELGELAQMQEEGGTGLNPESAFYEATEMGVESQMDEASQQIQENTIQHLDHVPTHPDQLPMPT